MQSARIQAKTDRALANNLTERFRRLNATSFQLERGVAWPGKPSSASKAAQRGTVCLPASGR